MGDDSLSADPTGDATAAMTGGAAHDGLYDGLYDGLDDGLDDGPQGDMESDWCGGVPAPPAVLHALLRVDLSRPLPEVLGRIAAIAMGELGRAGATSSAVSPSDVVGQVQGVSVVLTGDGHRVLGAGFAGHGAAALDERDLDVETAGPCLRAAATGADVLVAEAGPVMEGFARLARCHDVASAGAVVLADGPKVVGALGLYSRIAGALDAGFLQRARALAAVLVPPLDNVISHTRTAGEVDHLYRAMQSRAVVEQATGVLVARWGIDPAEAFDRLTRTSLDTGATVRAVAADLVRDARRRPPAGAPSAETTSRTDHPVPPAPGDGPGHDQPGPLRLLGDVELGEQARAAIRRRTETVDEPDRTRAGDQLLALLVEINQRRTGRPPEGPVDPSRRVVGPGHYRGRLR